jgi:hypothetical protein
MKETNRKRKKISVSISHSTIEKIEELRKVVIMSQYIDGNQKLVSFSSLVNELLDSGLEHRGKELWN